MTFHSVFNKLGQSGVLNRALVQLPLTVRPFTDCSVLELLAFQGATWSSRERSPSKSSSKLGG